MNWEEKEIEENDDSLLSDDSDNKENKTNDKLDEYKETKYFDDVWNYLMELISNATCENSSLHKYKFTKFKIYLWFVFFSLILLAIVLLIVFLLPYLLFNYTYTGNWKAISVIIVFAGFFVIWSPIYYWWKIYVLNKKLYKINGSQIIVYENKEYLVNLDFDTIKNLYQDSCFFKNFEEKTKPLVNRISIKKTCITYSFEKIFKYFTAIKRELEKGYSILEVYSNIDNLTINIVVK